MMSGHVYVSRLARLIAEYCVSIRKGDEVVINAGLEALPLVREIYREIVQRGGYPLLVNLRDEVLDEIFYKYAPDEVLEHVSPIERQLVEGINVSISILAPSHTRHLTSIDPDKVSRRSKARHVLSRIFLERSARGELRWTLAPYPTRALAQEADMSILEYEEFVFHATMVDREDPVRAWVEQARWQQRIADFLNRVSELHYKGPGIDFHIQVHGRKWINDDGKYNMPGGEVFTGPVEDTAEGYIEFDYPAIWRGREVSGIKLVFRRGEVVEAYARKGAEFLRKMIATDEGSKRLGELAFGLNYNITRFTREILFDEKIGGTMHIALGSSYPETGGKNVSSIHWDMIKSLRNHKVYADGDLVYENGRFIEEVL
jgi:aminopeptidase